MSLTYGHFVPKPTRSLNQAKSLDSVDDASGSEVNAVGGSSPDAWTQFA
jgi:hypothetical protein